MGTPTSITDFNAQARYVLPQFEERTAYGSKTHDPYSRLFQDRVVFLTTQVDATSGADIVAQLLALEAQSPTEDITLYINSPGGSITDMAMIVDTINLIKCDVRTVCLGLAASAAAILLTAGTKGKRSVLPNSRVMIHQPRMGEGTRGQASDLEIVAHELKESRDWMEKFLVNQTKQDYATVHRDVERDKYMNAREALEYGLVDHIIGSDAGEQ